MKCECGHDRFNVISFMGDELEFECALCRMEYYACDVYPVAVSYGNNTIEVTEPIIKMNFRHDSVTGSKEKPDGN